MTKLQVSMDSMSITVLTFPTKRNQDISSENSHLWQQRIRKTEIKIPSWWSGVLMISIPRIFQII